MNAWYKSDPGAALADPTKILMLNMTPPIINKAPAKAGPQSLRRTGFQMMTAKGSAKLNARFSRKMIPYVSVTRYLRIFCSTSNRPYQKVMKKANR